MPTTTPLKISAGDSYNFGYLVSVKDEGGLGVGGGGSAARRRLVGRFATPVSVRWVDASESEAESGGGVMTMISQHVAAWSLGASYISPHVAARGGLEAAGTYYSFISAAAPALLDRNSFSVASSGGSMDGGTKLLQGRGGGGGGGDAAAVHSSNKQPATMPAHTGGCSNINANSTSASASECKWGWRQCSGRLHRRPRHRRSRLVLLLENTCHQPVHLLQNRGAVVTCAADLFLFFFFFFFFFLFFFG